MSFWAMNALLGPMGLLLGPFAATLKCQSTPKLPLQVRQPVLKNWALELVTSIESLLNALRWSCKAGFSDQGSYYINHMKESTRNGGF